MLAANFLDYLPQPDDPRYFQAVAPFSNPVARGDRLFSLLKRCLVGAYRTVCFFLPALFDNRDHVTADTIKHSRLLQNRLRFRRPGILAYLRNCANTEVTDERLFVNRKENNGAKRLIENPGSRFVFTQGRREHRVESVLPILIVLNGWNWCSLDRPRREQVQRQSNRRACSSF